MSYKALYEYCQDAEIPVSRKLIKPKVEELCGRKIRIFKTVMDEGLLHGLFVSATNMDHQFAKQADGAHVIVVGRGQDETLERFVTVKEMMHVFDDELQRTNSGTDLEEVLAGFCSAEVLGNVSPQLFSEGACLYKAAGVLCPERMRAQLQQQRSCGAVTDAELAARLEVPEQFVPCFFVPRFKELIAFLTTQ